MGAKCWRCGYEDEPDFSGEREGAVSVISTMIFGDYYCTLCVPCGKLAHERYLRDNTNAIIRSLEFLISCFHEYATNSEFKDIELQLNHIALYQRHVISCYEKIDKAQLILFKRAESFIHELRNNGAPSPGSDERYDERDD